MDWHSYRAWRRVVTGYLKKKTFSEKIFFCAFSFFSCYLVWFFFLFCFVSLFSLFFNSFFFGGDFIFLRFLGLFNLSVVVFAYLMVFLFVLVFCLFSLFVCLLLCAFFFPSCFCYIQRVRLRLYEGREGHFALFHFLSHSFFIISLFSTFLCSFFIQELVVFILKNHIWSKPILDTPISID